MNRQRSAMPVALILLIISLGQATALSQQMSLASKVVERVLANGLKVLMVKDPNTPLVTCMLAFRVGSVNERPGITGISHFHEHMMFKGTRSMGIKPGTLEKDDAYNRQIDSLEAAIVKEETKIKGRDEAKIAQLKKQVSDLIKKEKAETVTSEEIWTAYQQAGGTQLNASTGDEMTHYYVTLPRNKIELFLALEADRLQNPVFREFYSERDVIVEERRMSENRPGYFFNEQLNATFYSASPYSWSVIGWTSDISRITKEEMTAFRSQYYRPDNAVLVMAGAVDVEPTMVLANKYFGAIKNPPGSAPRVRTEEPSPEYYKRIHGPDFKTPYIEKRVIGKAAANPYIIILFHIPPVWHEDVAVLHMLGGVMSARTGKIYLDLVLNKEHATSVGAGASMSEYDGGFSVQAMIKELKNEPVVPMAQLEKELWDFIEDAKTNPCDETVLQRVKNATEASYLRSLAGVNIAGSLEGMEIIYRWQFIEEQFKQRMAVTPADLMRIAQKYLTRDNSVTGVLEREK
jgi:predicted Zn-dependent peptidase